MRRLLGTVLVVLGLGCVLGLSLSGCGDDSSGSSRDPLTPAPTSTRTTESEPEVLRIVSQTAAGGELTTSAFRVDRPAGLSRLTRDFRTPGLGAKIGRIVERTELAPGQGLFGQVIAIGCDVPPSASVAVVDGKVEISAGKIPDPMPECFAAVTTVAIAEVDLPLG
jgi:hypothetical protein